MNFNRVKLLLFLAIIPGIFLKGCKVDTSKEDSTTSIETEAGKKSLWKEEEKRDFIDKHGKSDFERFTISELIKEYEFERAPFVFEKVINSRDYQKFKEYQIKKYPVKITLIAGKSPEEIKKVLEEPNHKEKVNPSGAGCPCDKYSYLNNLVEIVFINHKADWITVNNSSTFVEIDNISKYKSANKFDDYTYIKVNTR